MNNQIIGEQYYKGVLAAFLGASFFGGLVSEWQIDMVKEYISHFCERQIDQSPYSYQEKVNPKVLSVGCLQYQLVEVGMILDDVEPLASSFQIGMATVFIPGSVGGEWQADVGSFA